MSNRKNIILDLDQTLIYSDLIKDFKPSPKMEKFFYKNLDKDYITFARPHLQAFLDYIFKKYNVAIWTAANKPYAIAIINKFILIKPGRKLEFFYSDHCTLSKQQKRIKRVEYIMGLFQDSGI